LRIDPRPVVVAASRTNMLIRHGIRHNIIDLLSEADGTHQQTIAPAFIRIVDVGMKVLAFYRAWIETAGECCRQRKRTVIDARIRGCAIEVSAQSSRACWIENKTA